MGNRVNYEIVGDEGSVAVVLYANNSHPDVEPDRLFVEAVRDCATLSGAVYDLLGEAYFHGGNHRGGDPVFVVDPFPGDRAYVIRARMEGLFQGRPMAVRFERDNLDGTVDPVDPVTCEVVGDAPKP